MVKDPVGRAGGLEGAEQCGDLGGLLHLKNLGCHWVQGGRCAWAGAAVGGRGSPEESPWPHFTSPTPTPSLPWGCQPPLQ